MRGLSIGMDPLEYTPIEGSRFGMRFTKWSWLELSAVTIPANAQAMIALAKSLDVETAAASGIPRSRASSTPPSSTLPGVSGSHAPVAARMKTTSEQIAELQSQLKVKTARMADLAERESDGGLSVEERKEYDGIATDSDEISGRIARLDAISARRRRSRGPSV